jgi:antitoxin HigA-1
MAEKLLPPIHPGEILFEDLMKPLGLSQNSLAKELKVDPGTINRVVMGKSRISANMALRLARYFGTSPELWINLQARYDLEIEKDSKAAEIARRVHPRESNPSPVPA